MIRRALAPVLTLLTCLAGLLGLPSTVPAQSLIRDAEMEYALRQVAAPVLSAAGMGVDSIDILVLNDRSLNAFVVDGRHVFIHSGLLTRLDTPGQVQGVIAHELAHITNGHLVRRPANMRSARTAAGLGLALGLALAATGNPEAAGGVAVGVRSSAMRQFFAHTREEESAADRTALRTMAAAGIDPQEMVDVLDLFRGQEALSPGRQDLYVRSHPLTRDRLRAIESHAAAYSGTPRAPQSTDYWFQRMQAKLRAFLNNPSWVLRRIDRNDQGELATMSRAIAYHRTPDPARALAEADRLIAMRPDDPYYHELKGQILLESGRAQAAVGAYEAAVQLSPRTALLQAGLGRAQLASGDIPAALETLEQARARDPRDGRMLRDLATAYHQTGNPGMASLVTAERFALGGRFEDALLHAKRAAGQLPTGSTGWLRAQDIITAAEQAEKRKGNR